MIGDRPVVPAWPLHPADEHRDLLLWGLLSLLLHVAIVVLFVEAAGDGAARGGLTDREALTVRLRLPWQVRTAADGAGVSPPAPAEVRARRAPAGFAPAPDAAPPVASGAHLSAREPLPLLAMPTMRPFDGNVTRLAESPPPPQVVAEPLARITPLPSPLPMPEAPRLAEPPPMPRVAAETLATIAPLPSVVVPEVPRLPEPPPRPRIAAEPLARIAPLPPPAPAPDAPRLPEPPPMPRIAAEPLAKIAPSPPPVPVPDVAPLAEPPPSPRIDAQPLPRIAPLSPPAKVPEAPQLSEPPPLPRVTAEPLPKAAALPTLSIPDAPALAEPAPLPRIDEKPLPRIESSPPTVRSVDVAPLAEPGRVAAPARRNPAPPLPAASSGGVTGTVAPTTPAPQRFDFGPRRVVDPDLAALVGETPAAPGPPGRVDSRVIRDVARDLNRSEGGARGRRGAESGGTAAEPESTLGRAIARSAQPDCRLAYSGLGLLGLPFLLFDTMTDTGCRW